MNYLIVILLIFDFTKNIRFYSKTKMLPVVCIDSIILIFPVLVRRQLRLSRL